MSRYVDCFSCYLLEKYADALVIDGFVLVDNEEHLDKKLSFRPEDVDKILGITISEEDMKAEMKSIIDKIYRRSIRNDRSIQ